MDLRDLGEAGPKTSVHACDVCIIGAGAAGLYLARLLSKSRLDVVVLEAGPRRCVEAQEAGFLPEFSGAPYAGALVGRAFGWGGTTSRWGGVLIPHSPLDLRAGDHGETWRHIVREVGARSSRVLQALGLGDTVDFHEYPARALRSAGEALKRRGLALESAEFMPFLKRNLSFLVAGRGGPRVEVNAVAHAWTFGKGGAAESVEARSREGRSVRVTARHFVIAAGALESARILLEIHRATGEKLFPPTAAIGAFLGDHLSCRIADVPPDSAPLVARMFGPRFRRGRLRNFRFVDLDTGDAVPRHFAHFLFHADYPAFRLARNVIADLQGRRFPRLPAGTVLSGGKSLLAMGWNRVAKGRLYIPKRTETALQLDIEQAADRSNAVSLGTTRDAFGRLTARIHWEVTARDRENIASVASGIMAKWPSPAEGFPEVRPLRAETDASKPHDAYHPVGCTRMGSDAEAVVDLGLRARGAANISVVTTGIFPTAGTANPTFSMLCLADGLAERLVSELRA